MTCLVALSISVNAGLGDPKQAADLKVDTAFKEGRLWLLTGYNTMVLFYNGTLSS